MWLLHGYVKTICCLCVCLPILHSIYVLGRHPKRIKHSGGCKRHKLYLEYLIAIYQHDKSGISTYQFTLGTDGGQTWKIVSYKMRAFCEPISNNYTVFFCFVLFCFVFFIKSNSRHFIHESKGWIALKWQILWETNKFQVSFCSPFKFVRRFFVEKTKRATANNKGADQPARTRRLICAFVVRTYIKAGFLSDSRHRSSTSCTTFVWTALQWRTNIHTLKHWVYFCTRMNTKLNSSQSHFL